MNASRPEMGTQIRDSRHAVKDVSESQEEYCDASAQADLVLGELAMPMVYIVLIVAQRSIRVGMASRFGCHEVSKV